MGTNILPRDVGNEDLVSIALAIKNEAVFSLLLSGTETLGSKKDAELKWHVEAWEAVGWIGLGSGNVMNPKLALFDHAQNFVDPGLARIIELPGAAGDIAAMENREDDGIEYISVSRIEWAVYEYAPCIFRTVHLTFHSSSPLPLSAP